MKATMILRGAIRLPAICIAVMTAMIIPGNSTSQSAVSAVFTHPQNATTATTYSGTGATGNAASGLTGNTYTYKFGTNVAATNNISILDSMTAYALNYRYQPAAYFVKFRRVNNASVTGLRKSFRIEQNGVTVAPGGTVAMYPDYDDSLERVFTKRIFNIGIDNVFQNATTTNNSNVERIDVIFPAGVKATDNTKAGFVVFDWGAAGGHDPFYIAAIKTLDAVQHPSAYYAAVSVTAGNYGSNIGGSADYVILRKNPSDAGLLMMNNTTSQTRDGVFVRFSDLSAPSNTLIYGYSLFSPDGTVTPVIKMVDTTNASNFPTTTDLGGGGLDPLAVTGLWVTDALYVLLPDRIDELHASLTDDKIKLSWDLHTTDELREQVVERSADGAGYSPILHLPIGEAGPQTTVDAAPLPGTNYYRVKLVRQDGAVAAYSSVSRADIATAGSLSLDIYPNPVKNKQLSLDIRGLGNNGSYDLLLLDMNGRPVLRHSLGGRQVIQTVLPLPKTIPAGMYTLRLTDNTGNSKIERRVIVE